MQRRIRPYGDKTDDGVIQMSFTLPVPAGPRAREAARLLLEREMGMKDVKIASMEGIATDYTYFVAYASTQASLDYDAVDVPIVKTPNYGFTGVNQRIESELKRHIIVVGGNNGFDSHTVGIDAIINMKGFSGDYGLERYPWFRAFNLGAQLKDDEFLDRAVEVNADAVLVSKVVTQRDIHKEDALGLIQRAKDRGLRDRFIFVIGGPRLTHKEGLEWGFDAGFGPGTKPSDVASYLADEVIRRARGRQR
ncbi:MAG: cobalamin B12-binding domain-containing protein [Deltaproteobacteria bacterium]|nr:cobalamin B12-binding domain-containing protein [Deltaproteobacteria bacterium]